MPAFAEQYCKFLLTHSDNGTGDFGASVVVGMGGVVVLGGVVEGGKVAAKETICNA